MQKRSIPLALGVITLLVAATVPAASAQQNIGYVDAQSILESLPEFATVQQSIDKLASDWEAEIREQQRKIDEMFRTYQTRELLYTNDERQRKREEIVQAEEQVEALRKKYFGPDGQWFTQQDNLMAPLQTRIVEAIEEVAVREGYDFVFDRGGDYLFLYARDQHDLTQKVQVELGIDIDRTRAGNSSN